MSTLDPRETIDNSVGKFSINDERLKELLVESESSIDMYERTPFTTVSVSEINKLVHECVSARKRIAQYEDALKRIVTLGKSEFLFYPASTMCNIATRALQGGQDV